MKLKSILESRLDLAAIYVKFHAEADIVSKELDNLNASVQNSSDSISDESLKQLEEKWEAIVPLYQSAKNTGLTFITQSDQVSVYISVSCLKRMYAIRNSKFCFIITSC